MTLRPSSPLEFASPVGKRDVFELRSMRALSSAEAHRNITRARNSSGASVSASTARTPVARSVRSSYITSATTLLGRNVRRPVALAAGKVEPTLLKYEWVIQPRWHGPQRSEEH